MATALEIVFLVRVLHVRPALTGALVSAGGAGGIAAGIASNWLQRRIGSARIIAVSIPGFGAPAVLMPLAEPGWRLAFFAAGLASYTFSGVLYNIAQLSFRQAICPPELLGRLNAAIRWIVWGTLPAGGFLGGVLGAAVGVRATIWIGVLGAWAGGWWAFFSPLRRMRDAPS